MSQKNVFLKKIIVKGFRPKKVKEEWIAVRHPKEGYREVHWVVCPKDREPMVIGCLVTRKAQKFVRIVNTLSRADAITLVQHLHDAGRSIQSRLLHEKSKDYSGRSFERPRI